MVQMTILQFNQLILEPFGAKKQDGQNVHLGEMDVFVHLEMVSMILINS
jgi:hypothetical protein